MSMTRKKMEAEQELWLPTHELKSPGNRFYERLSKLLYEYGFDPFVEQLCSKFYSEGKGRPSIPPGVYFRMLFVGYFEAVHSERGLCWRIADSLSLRQFVGLELTESVPDHSALSRIRQRYSLEVQIAVFGWVLDLLRKEGLLKGRRLGVDSTTLEANASMRSIVERTSEKTYRAYIRDLARADGVEDPGPRDATRMDRKRKKSVSNKDWKSPVDPDGQIARMKNGTTRVAHKVEHAVDMDTGALVSVEVYGGSSGDTRTIEQTLTSAENYLEERPEEVIADAGYHSNEVLKTLKAEGQRSYIAEPRRGKRNWKKDPLARQAVYANRVRNSRRKGVALQRKRGELLERSFQHTYDRCGMKHLHLRGGENNLKRLLVHGCAYNLSLAMRKLVGSGTPKAYAVKLGQHVRFVWRYLAGRLPMMGLHSICPVHPIDLPHQHPVQLTGRSVFELNKMPHFSTAC